MTQGIFYVMIPRVQTNLTHLNLNNMPQSQVDAMTPLASNATQPSTL